MTKKFYLTKDRSLANSKYQFSFVEYQQAAIVPVLQQLRGLGGYNIIGTASFFSVPNLFVTASHIFEGTDINENDRFCVIIEGSEEPYYISKIMQVSADISLIALEGVEPLLAHIKPFRVLNGELALHEVVACYGYAHSNVSCEEVIFNGDSDPLQPMNLRAKWEIGGIINLLPEGRGHLDGSCIETSVLVEGRDSGGPLFINGFFIGVASMSFGFDEGLPNSLFSSIQQILNLELNGVKILDMVKNNSGSVMCKLI